MAELYRKLLKKLASVNVSDRNCKD